MNILTIYVYIILFIVIAGIDGYLKYSEMKKKHYNVSKIQLFFKSLIHGFKVSLIVSAIIIIISIICILIFNQNNIMY